MSGINGRYIRWLPVGIVLVLLNAVAAQAQIAEGEASAGQPFRLSMGFAAELDSEEFGDYRITHSKLSGVLFNAEDSGFCHQATMRCNTVDDNGFVMGYCSITDADGDAFYLMIQRAATPQMDSWSDGEMLILSGTGKYSGISGGASYTVAFEPATSVASIKGMMSIEGTYRLPIASPVEGEGEEEVEEDAVN